MSGADKNDCASWCVLPADHDGVCKRSYAERVVPDYIAMTGAELLDAVGDDASRWAEAFCQIAKTHGHELDEGWMISWFANAIEHSSDIRYRRSTPDTRHFFNLKFPH